MQEFNRGILYTLRELYNQDNVTLPRKTVARLLDQVLRDEEDAETDTLAGIELLLKQAGSTRSHATAPPLRCGTGDNIGAEAKRKLRNTEADVRPAPADVRPAPADVRLAREYARELREADPDLGATTLIRMIMEHFNISQNAMARLLGINQGWLSSYLREGKRSKAVMAALTALVGDDGAAGQED